MVGHAGGPIGLGVAARHPEWFSSLVLAGTFGWSLKEYPKVRRMLGIVSSPVFGFFQEHSNFLQGVLGTLYVPDGSGAPAGVWVVFNGESRDAVEHIIQSLPLYPYMQLELTPLRALQAAR